MFRNGEGLITHNIDTPISYQRLYLLSNTEGKRMPISADDRFSFLPFINFMQRMIIVNEVPAMSRVSQYGGSTIRKCSFIALAKR